MGLSTLVWAGRVGHGRHGGEAPALWGGPMMSALILSPFDFVESLISHQGERASVEHRHRRSRIKSAMTAWDVNVVV